MRYLIASIGLAIAPAHHSSTVQKTPSRQCPKTFTVKMIERAINAELRGTRRPTKQDHARINRYIACSRNPNAIKFVQGYRQRAVRAWRKRMHPPMYKAVASVYDAAGGPIACGGNSYAMGVANKYLPCGTKLYICYAACVDAIVFDRGPYAPGRDFDLSRNVENAIGFPYGVDKIRYTYRK